MSTKAEAICRIPEEELLNTGLDENVYDAVLESTFPLMEIWGRIPEVHLVLVPIEMKI